MSLPNEYFDKSLERVRTAMDEVNLVCTEEGVKTVELVRESSYAIERSKELLRAAS